MGRLAPASPPSSTQAPNELSAWNFNMLKMTVVLLASQHLMLLKPQTPWGEEERGTDDVRGLA